MAAVRRVVTPDEIRAFRARHGIKRQEDLDQLFGFKSAGRSARRWEEVGAPGYVAILIAYVDRYGLDLMKELAEKREAEIERPASPSASIGASSRIQQDEQRVGRAA